MGQTGGSHRFFIHLWRDDAREGERREVTSTLSLAPVFYGRSLLKGGLKKCSGMLNVLPYMVPVKKETPQLVAQKW